MDSFDKHILTITQVLTALNIKLDNNEPKYIIDKYAEAIDKFGRIEVIKLYEEFFK